MSNEDIDLFQYLRTVNNDEKIHAKKIVFEARYLSVGYYAFWMTKKGKSKCLCAGTKSDINKALDTAYNLILF